MVSRMVRFGPELQAIFFFTCYRYVLDHFGEGVPWRGTRVLISYGIGVRYPVRVARKYR